VFVVYDAGSSPANIPCGAWTDCYPIASSHRVSPVDSDFLQPISSHPRDLPASTLTPCGMIEDLLHATLEISAYFVCHLSCCRHQSVISGSQNVVLISIGSEW